MTRKTMVRRGVIYKIERNPDGTFGRFIPTRRVASVSGSGRRVASKKAVVKLASPRMVKKESKKPFKKRKK